MYVFVMAPSKLHQFTHQADLLHLHLSTGLGQHGPPLINLHLPKSIVLDFTLCLLLPSRFSSGT